MAKTALITGIAGQDGSYLAELLLAKNYRVHGTIRHSGPTNLWRIDSLLDQVELHRVDAQSDSAILALLEQVRPDEIYNLASHSFVPASWRQPVETAQYTALTVTRLLEAIRQVDPAIRFYQAGSSELFGQASDTPQNETTRFSPTNPYAIAKSFAHWTTAAFREKFGLFACAGILFNHESPRRSLEFVTRKITHEVARIKLGLSGQVRLGNLLACRDWGFAADHVRAMWMMLQHDVAADYVVGTGHTHTVQQFAEEAFRHVDLDWQRYVVVDPEFYRPLEPGNLVADPSKARRELGWQPTMKFQQLVATMVDADLARVADSDVQANRKSAA